MISQMSSELSPSAIRAAVERIVASPTLKGSERLARLLRFVVEETVSGRDAGLKESVLGVEVFQRGGGFDPKTDPVVRVSAGRLRAKLIEYYAGDGVGDPVLIRLPKGGYVPVFELRGEPRHWGSLWLAAGACGLLLALGAAFLLTSNTLELATHPRSVAVLPFVNMSGEAGGEYFSDGLTEELIDALCRIDGLRVTARTSAFQFKGKARDIREVGKLLKVETVVEGSVRKQGDRIRITAQLNSVKDGYHIWSRSYEVTLRDALRTQEEISRAIASALQAPLTGKTRRAPVNPRAWEAYLRGRYFLGRAEPSAIQRVFEGFQEAIAIDPNLAEAHAALARLYIARGRAGALPPREAIALANASVTRALAIDGDNTDALLAVCQIKSEAEWDWVAAEQSCSRALELSPGSQMAHTTRGMALGYTGRLDDAIQEHSRAVELDPLSVTARIRLARSLYSARRYDEASNEAGRILYLDGSNSEAFVVLGLVSLAEGKHAEAIAYMRKTIGAMGPRENPNVQSMLGHAYAVSGNRTEAHRLLRWLEERAKTKPTTSTLAARIHLGLGNYDRALDLLEAAYDERDYWLPFLVQDPRTDPIRSHPRFVKLLRKMNLPGS